MAMIHHTRTDTRAHTIHKVGQIQTLICLRGWGYKALWSPLSTRCFWWCLTPELQQKKNLANIMKIISHFLYSGFKSSGLSIKCFFFFFSIGDGIQNSAWNSFSKSREILLKEHWLVIGHTLTDGPQFTLEPLKLEKKQDLTFDFITNALIYYSKYPPYFSVRWIMTHENCWREVASLWWLWWWSPSPNPTPPCSVFNGCA